MIRLSVIGVGLIGGSLGLALKKNFGEDIHILGYGRNRANLDAAVKLGAIDEIAPNLQIAAKADVIYLATPILQMVPIIKNLLPHIAPETIITDCGSTKGEIFSAVKQILPKNVYFIAGHPMTGREKSGVTAAKANLFENKMYVIIKDEDTPNEIYDRLMRLLVKTGAKFTYLPIAAHDGAASVISHLPHIAAAAMVHLLEESPHEEVAKNLIGGGFRDTTRIASSNADMWADILMTNSSHIVRNIDDYIGILQKIKAAIMSKDRTAAHSFFSESKSARDALLLETEPKFDAN
ncbi:MAG: prephenate dehydrogenase [Selenomonadaceae bacterium]|nr:prephenate dehydrogenase [Selenomonadaceae bacterium]